MAGRKQLRHILVPDKGEAFNFRSSGGPSSRKPPSRDRASHSNRLLGEIVEARQAADAARAAGIDVEGYQLTVRSAPDGDLPLESLDSSGLKLLGVQTEGNVIVATVFVPLGKLQLLEDKIRAFSMEETIYGAPKYARLVANIESIRTTALHELWKEPEEPFPEADATYFWEVWLRDETPELEARFVESCRSRGLSFGTRPLRFPNRTVLLIVATVEQLSAAPELIDCVAELRRARLNAAEFTGFESLHQAEWIGDLVSRLEPPSPDSPVVCLLDTGVNNQHPLLSPLVPSNDIHSYLQRWGTHDHDGHGTQMAGLAGYGELTEVFARSGPIAAEHGLESVKILPPPPEVNPPELYGSITIDACAQPELRAPLRPRVYSMAVTTTDGRNKGRPSSWSAALDALASGRDDGQRRLFCVSIGNSDPNGYQEYPDSLMTAGALDPAQAWNVLTIGAYTEKSLITEPTLTGWEPLAPKGDLSPTSSTSMTFGKSWPVKPDVVLEGGNVAQDSTGRLPPVDGIDSLSLLTTNHNLLDTPLRTTNATSAATALASHLAAQLMAEYPEYWPETIRALIIHSARWTGAMLHRYGAKPRTLLRSCGYGVPSLTRARWSARDALTLVIQSSLHPYRKEEKGDVKAGQMRLHQLPWPREALLELGGADVRLRVTLSYFVDPNPSERGWKMRYAYASHQLRFDMQRPTETPEVFAARVNEEQRDADYKKSQPYRGPRWKLGRERDYGSCHSDVWEGRAADLATREHIAVYPVGGWWKHTRDKWKTEVRYALIVSVETDDLTADLYTPVANQVGVAVETEIE